MQIAHKNSVLEKLLKQYPGKLVTPSTLRFEQKVVNGQQIFEMKMLDDNGQSQVTERRLRKNDVFVASEIGMFIINRDTTIPGIEVLQSYPNPQVFPDETTNFIGKHLEVLYNSQIRYSVGQKNIIEGLDTKRFRSIDTLIQTSSSTASSDKPDMGFETLVPQIKISGKDTTKLELVLPTTANLKIANTVANHDNYVVIMLRGYLIPE